MYRNLDREYKQLKLLQKKWGKRIVKLDWSDKSHKSNKKKMLDINPIIKIPMKGV